MKPLSGKQRGHLKAIGHSLEPVVRIGKGGITDGLVNAVSEALLVHELVKIKVLEEAPLDRKEAATQLAERCEAYAVQVVGKTLLLYRRHPTQPKIVLPRADEDKQE